MRALFQRIDLSWNAPIIIEHACFSDRPLSLETRFLASCAENMGLVDSVLFIYLNLKLAQINVTFDTVSSELVISKNFIHIQSVRPHIYNTGVMHLRLQVWAHTTVAKA